MTISRSELGTHKQPNQLKQCKAVFRPRLQFKYAFDTATKRARQGARRRAAILRMDPERFDAYLVAASVQYKGDHMPISSQEDLVDPQAYERRFVVSMPEYVSGLQFDDVLVLDVNDDATGDDATGFHRKHFLTDLYLASSRAKSHLELRACTDNGGLSTLLNRGIELAVLKGR
jgi:hypothetical protein